MCKKITYKEQGKESHAITGVFIKSEAVCEGIAKAYKAICDEVQVECCVVNGKAKSSLINGYQNHSWNKVKINNNWFNIDVTFDLTMSNKNFIRHDYMFLSDSEISNTHVCVEDIFSCSTKNMDYYSINKLIMFNQQNFIDYLKKMLAAGEKYIEIKLLSVSNIEKIEQKILNNISQVLRELNIDKKINLCSNKELLVFGIEIL